MKLSLVLCIVGASVAFVCTCYGAISIIRIRKKEKAETEKERKSKYLYLSTSWLMWADLYGIKVSNITPVEEYKNKFIVLFGKRSSDKISHFLENSTISKILKGHFEKLDNGRYQFVNDSLADSQHDIEKLMLYFSMMTAMMTESEVQNV